MASRIEKIINEIHVSLNDASIEKVIGRLACQEQHGGPSVSWIPVGGNVAPPKNIGGKLLAAGEGQGPTAERQNQIATRSCAVEAYCWGGNGLGELEAMEATEQIVHNVIAAVNVAIGKTAITLRGERWITQEAKRGGWLVDGQLCALDFVFQIPVIGEVSPLTTITGVLRACKLNSEPE